MATARGRWLLALPAVAALVCGVLSGLARLGWAVPPWAAFLAAQHGALMIGGFFGTLIGLERAVALARGWPYAAPAASGLAALVLIGQGGDTVAALLMSFAAAVMAAACGTVWWRERAAHLATLAAGALAWLAGSLVWAHSGIVATATPLWAAFLILTIAGERLELSRLMPTPRGARRVFALIAALLCVAALMAVVTPWGLRLFALALSALAVWLWRYDIARRTVRGSGLTRYMAVCLLSGYAWLMVAGMLGVAGAFAPGAPLRDAALHALLLGFVFSMVFGHAPVIVPALTRCRFAWHTGLYLPLLLLHLTLGVRVWAGLAGQFAWRTWSGAANTLALIVFACLAGYSLYRARRA
ncbi:MAG: hypothetical protein QM639_09390 [Rhodocyclaceae bacterium]